jgi:predicted Zn-dependent protease
VSRERLIERLEALAPGAWELYSKHGVSREIRHAPRETAETSRTEEGFAARWWDPAPRFAAAGDTAALAEAVERARETPAPGGSCPVWPTGAAAVPQTSSMAADESPPELHDELARLVAAESRGEATLTELTVRRGRTVERVVNAAGLDVGWGASALTGFASAVGRRGTRACEARMSFRWDGAPELATLARRLSDRATLPLSDRSAAVDRGDWLLEPSVGAALLAGLAPLFCRETTARWPARGGLLAPEVTIVDDAGPDAPFDGEGTRTRRVVVFEKGGLSLPLRDLDAARRDRAFSTGNGVRRSYRTPPRLGARRLFFETGRPAPPRELLAAVRRGLFASALTAPWRCDLENDRYEAEFTGIAVIAGRAQGPVAAARSRGRLSELLRRITALAPSGETFPSPEPVLGATLLAERVPFD